MSQPAQVIQGYFGSRPAYADVSSLWGLANTHTPRIWLDDFNNDGLVDAVGLASLWPGSGFATYPVALQMLQNQGNLQFSDVSDSLSAEPGVISQEFNYEMRLVDIDDSGIKSYFNGDFAPHDAQAYNDNQTNYLIVNDGTGKLRVALHDTFKAWGDQVNRYVETQLNLNRVSYTEPPETPMFIAYRTAAGKLNFVAAVQIHDQQVGAFTPEHFAFVNVPVNIDVDAQFTAQLTAMSRNRSRRIRTFAGDDTIHGGPHDGIGTIDGGLGSNTVVYSGQRSSYSIALDGSTYVVTDNVGNDGVDRLTRIQHLKFSDQTFDLSGGVVIDSGFTGAWFDPNQSGHGLFLEVLPDNRLLAWWFAFDPAGAKQAWFGGVGPIAGTIATVDAALTTGGRWIPNFDPSKIVDNPWGTLTFTFSDCGHGRVDFHSTMSGYSNGHMDLTRLTEPAGVSCPVTDAPPDPNLKSFTGAWFDPSQSGHGLFLESLQGDQLLAWWFAFDASGNQSWFGGVGPATGNSATVPADLTTGGRWIPNFDPTKIVNTPWGTLSFTFSDCAHGSVDFSSSIAGYGAGHMDLTRLTLPAGFSCP
jgi:hypothetical protein